MTIPQIVLLIVFIAFITGCGIYIARASKRAKQHLGPHPGEATRLETERLRTTKPPSSR